MQPTLESFEPGRVSVVIPHFNRENVICRAIDSAVQQTYQNVEVIVVDDGSNDPQQIVDIVDGYDERVRLVRHVTNRNGAAARNTGVKSATGQWIAFLDSDDEWLPNKTEVQVQEISQFDDSDVILSTQSDVRTEPNQKPFTKIWPARAIQTGERVADYLFCNRGYLPTPSLFLSRELALRIPFNDTLKRHQDYDLFFSLEQAGIKMHLVKEPLVIVHWEDLHSSGRGLNPSSSLSFLEEYRSSFSEKARASFILGQIIIPLLRAGRRKEAIWHMRQHVPLSSTSKVQLTSLASYFAFQDDRLLKLLARIHTWWR